MSKFAIMLRSLREEKGLTQNEIAKNLGMNRTQYSNYELGLREPDLDTLELISDYFNVDIDYIVGKTLRTTKYTKAHDLFHVEPSEEEILMEELHKNPELKTLMYEGKNMSADTLKLIIEMVKKMKE